MLDYLKNRALEESTVVFLQISLIIMQLRPQNVILWNRRNGFKHDLSQAAYLWMKYFLCMDFIVTLIHCVTYKDVSHFSKSKHIWSFRVNCNKYLTDFVIKPLFVQKSLCLLMWPFNHPENKGITSLHPSLSHTVVLIIFIKSITLNIMSKVYVLVFHLSLRERRPKYDVTKNDVTLYDVTLRSSFFARLVWKGLFY